MVGSLIGGIIRRSRILIDLITFYFTDVHSSYNTSYNVDNSSHFSVNDSTTTTTVNNEVSNDVSLIEDSGTDTRCVDQRQTTTTTVWGSTDEKENLSPNVSFGAPTR